MGGRGGLRPFFQLPVYAETQDEYHDRLDAKVAPYGDAWVARGDKRESGERYGRQLFGTSWEYNLVVGWIELQAASDVIKGHYWWTTQARIRLDRRVAHAFEYKEKFTECWLDQDMTSGDVFERLSERLDVAARERPFKGRWIDRTAFNAVGPYVDFAAFLGWNR